MMAIPVRSIAVAVALIFPVSSSSPHHAMIFRKGMTRNVYGQMDMQKLYVVAVLTLRRTIGITRSCMSTDMAPQVARQKPIWDTWWG
jgi:hypothetical protein